MKCILVGSIASLMLAACATPAATQPPVVQTVVVPQTVVVTPASKEPRAAETRAAETRAAESSPTNTPTAAPTTASRTPHPPAIVSISVCSLHGAGGAGSCPSGSFDTHQIVLAPDGSGNAINTYGVGTTSDEHSSVFSPGTLQGNRDYLFFVAAATKLSVDIGLVVLSGGSGPDKNSQWTFDFPKADDYGQYASGFGHIFIAPTVEAFCPTVADGNPAHQDKTFDLTYAAPGSLVKDPTSAAGSLLMIYESVNTCVGSTGGRRPTNGAYITTGITTSLDEGRTWPTYRGTPSFGFVPLPSANRTQGPNAPAGAFGKSVCMGNDCSKTPPANYGRYPVLSPPVSLATIMAMGKPLDAKLGYGEPAAFVDDVGGSSAPYLYIVHGYVSGDLAGPPLLNGRNTDLTVARARLNDGTAPLGFMKWNGKSFAEPGIGGVESPILPDGPYQACGDQSQGRHSASISYVEETQQYLLTFICSSPTDPASGRGAAKNKGSAWFYSTSYDLSDPRQWSSPQEIIGSWSEWSNPDVCPDYKGRYPTFMSLGKKPGHLSTSGYVFYLWICLGGAGDDVPPKRQFSSRAFTITMSR